MENKQLYRVKYLVKFSQILNENISQNKNNDSNKQNINVNQNFLNTIVIYMYLNLEKYSRN